MALVIGNGNYTSSILANPENDANSMTEVLQRLGFTVFKYENLNASQMKKAIDDFGAKLKGNDVGLFFYAGHGIQTKGYNYLIPVDAILQSEQEVEYECVQADRILAKMEGSGTKVNIIILDACRNNPFERSWTRSEIGKGLAFMSAPRGTLIAYSTSPGSTASDGSGKNSPYTSAILESIEIPDISISQMFQNVGRILYQKTGNLQVPWISSSLIGDFYFLQKDVYKEVSNISVNNQSRKEVPSNDLNKNIDDKRNKKKLISINLGYDLKNVFNYPENIVHGYIGIIDYSWTKSKIFLNSVAFSENNGKTASNNQFNNLQLGYLKGIYFENTQFHFDFNAGVDIGLFNLKTSYTFIYNPDYPKSISSIIDTLYNSHLNSFDLSFPFSVNVYYKIDKGIILGLFLYGSKNLYTSRKVYSIDREESKTGKSFLSIGFKIGYRF